MLLLVANYWTNSNNTTTSKSFEYNTKIIRRTPANTNTGDTEVVVPLTDSINFWRSLDLPLINCEIEFYLSLLKNV